MLVAALVVALCQASTPVYAHIHGRVLDAATEKPVPGIMVEAYQRGVWAAVEHAISDGRGGYDISGLKPGSYAVLIVSAETPAVRASEAGDKPRQRGYGKFFYPESDNIDAALPLILAEGEHRQLDIRLERKELSRLVGEIDVIGDRPEEISFIAQRILGPHSAVQAFSGSPNKAGEFTVDRLPAGEYLIYAHGVTADGVKLGATGKVIVAPHDTARLTLVMQPGITVLGRVRLADESVVPKGLKVNLLRSDLVQFDRATAAVNEKGAFQMEGVAVGSYFVVVAGLPTGYKVLHGEVEITSNSLDVVIAKEIR